MASHTELVTRMSQTSAIPANRPLDHARRISVAAGTGIVVGTFLGIFLKFAEITFSGLFLAWIPALLAGLAVIVTWRVLDYRTSGDPIPVVARTLATSETPYLRYVRSGGQRGLLVPVVAKPVGEGDPFRSVILLSEQRRGEEVRDPEPGTLLMLQQNRPGMGELSDIGQPTDEQRALRDQLQRRPRQLSNNAPSLPLRRGVLERTPRWAAVQWWASMIIGGCVAVLYVFWLVA